MSLNYDFDHGESMSYMSIPAREMFNRRYEAGITFIILWADFTWNPERFLERTF